MLTTQTPLRIVIPAAGLGTRFLPLTRVMPKELLPLGEWPLIHHALAEVDRAGFEEAVIVTSPRKHAIRSYFDADRDLEDKLEQEGKLWELARLRDLHMLTSRVKVRFIEKETRGPGEAVLLAQRLTGDETLGVLLPDDVIPSAGHWNELLALWHLTGTGTLCVRTVPGEEISRFGIAVCERDNGRLRLRHLVEKPEVGSIDSPYRIFGRYIVTAPIMDALEERFARTAGEVQLTDGYAACLDDPGIFAAEFSAAFFDCGTPADYARSVASSSAFPP